MRFVTADVNIHNKFTKIKNAGVNQTHYSMHVKPKALSDEGCPYISFFLNSKH